MSVGEFEALRPRLFGLAYRLLGSTHDAEDIVQDAFIRWSKIDRAAVVDPSAWLAKVVTNLCINRASLARVRRERYVGPWLPEPVVVTADVLGPLETVEQRDSVSFAFLVLLERLTAAERAVFVLREAFGYRHRDIALVMDWSEARCRQVYRRARQRVTDPSRRFDADRTQHIRLVERFLAAIQDGNLRELEQVLAADVESWADGGGEAIAARRPVSGRERVARYLLGSAARFGGSMEVTVFDVNRELAVVAWARGMVVAVVVFQVADGQIAVVRTIANPNKLRFLNRQAENLSRSDRRFTAPRGESQLG